MSEYCSLHVNIPNDMRDRIQALVDSGRYLNISDATRHYVRNGVEEDEKKRKVFSTR